MDRSNRPAGERCSDETALPAPKAESILPVMREPMRATRSRSSTCLARTCGSSKMGMLDRLGRCALA